MDAITPPFNPASNSRRGRLRYLIIFVFLVLVFGGTFWYVNRGDKQVKRAGPVFDPARQSVPKGATSLEVSKALTAFNFLKPLPFFDERNVVQSFDLNSGTSTILLSTVYISYRVSGQAIDVLHARLTQYFEDMKWRMDSTNGTAPISDNLLFRSPLNTHGPSRIIQVSFFENSAQPKVSRAHPDVIVGLLLHMNQSAHSKSQ